MIQPLIHPTPFQFDAERSTRRMNETLAAEQAQKRAEFIQAGKQAWQHYQETGLHLPLEQADAWLAKLESGVDAEPPACQV